MPYSNDAVPEDFLPFDGLEWLNSSAPLIWQLDLA
jgi:hypothetical protein